MKMLLRCKITVCLEQSILKILLTIKILITVSEMTRCVSFIALSAGVLVIVDTPNEHKYERIWKDVSDRQFWTFMVRAGGDVHVLLTEQLGVTETNLYEFVIGGWQNNRTVIRTAVLGGGDSIKATLDAKNLVSASERREFWISWWKGQLEVNV